jgi:hypothetical protein
MPEEENGGECPGEGRLAPTAVTSPVRPERAAPYLTRGVSLGPRVGVHNFRTFRVCLHREKRKPIPPTGQRNYRQADYAVGASIHSEVNRSWLFRPEELQSIASILAAGYLRCRRTRREDPLDNAGTSSPHGHEVNGPEKGEGLGDHGPERD